MLLRNHGASTLGRVLRRSCNPAMTSFSGTLTLATDAMRSITALLGRPSSALARPATKSKSRVWNPTHGIVFGGNPVASIENPRALSTNNLNITEQDLTIHSTVEDSYVLSKSISSSLSPESLLSQLSNEGDRTASSQISDPNCLPPDEPRSDETNFLIEDEPSEIHEPLSFQLSQEALQNAKDAEVGSSASFWSYRMYTGPEGQNVKVHYCRSKHTTESVLKYFIDKKVLGFDIEWKPDSSKYAGIKSNVSLIQLASEDRIALFHIALYPKDGVEDLVAPTLKQIMENPEITKVGVAIKADCTRLRKYLNIDSRGILELSHLYKLVKYSSSGDFGMINKRLVSLSDQVKEHVGIPLFKGEVRGSDWSQALSMDQIIYAASDTYAGFILNDILEAKRKQLKPTPPRPHHAELNIPIRLASGTVISTAEEASEEPEISVKSKSPAAPHSPLSAAEAAMEGIQIEEDAENPPVPSKPNAKSLLKDSNIPKPPLVQTADSWATAYRSSRPATSYSANHSALRAYTLWQNNPSLSVGDIAALLRDPPLQKSTVASYVADAIRLEKLPFERERLRELLGELSPYMRGQWRFKGLWDMVGGE